MDPSSNRPFGTVSGSKPTTKPFSQALFMRIGTRDAVITAHYEYLNGEKPRNNTEGEVKVNVQTDTEIIYDIPKIKR